MAMTESVITDMISRARLLTHWCVPTELNRLHAPEVNA